MRKNFHKNKYNSGTTLIELLVVIGIFAMISGITIFNYGKFNSSLTTQNLADDIALTIRRAQGYAIGVRGYDNAFDSGYGVHFTPNSTISDLYAGSKKSFILFADLDGKKDYTYDNSEKCGDVKSSNECIEMLNILSSDEIISIVVNEETEVLPGGSVDVLFKRPDPEPKFCYRRDSDSISCTTEDSSSIKIKLSSGGKDEMIRWISIYNNGQISVSSNNN